VRVSQPVTVEVGVVLNSEPKIYGFWSYAREQGATSARLHEALERSLREALGRNPELEILHDVKIPVGHDFRAEIVRSIARSILFFWLQSPSSLASPVCRFEFEMFRAQVARIARCFSTTASVDAERLWRCWLVPIRWEDMDPRQWDRMGNAPETVELANLWRDTQISDDFNIAKSRVSEERIREHGKAMAAPIRSKLFTAMELLTGQTLDSLLAFVAEEDSKFIATWLARFPFSEKAHRALSSAVSPQRRLADARTGGRTRCTQLDFNMDFFLVPLDKAGNRGFWASVAPLGEPWAAQFRKQLSTGRRGPNGHALWPADAVPLIADTLRACGLDLPDPIDAAALLEIAMHGPTACAQLGWITPVRNFWSRSKSGDVAAAAPHQGDLPILLVKQLC
jgi:hypothetical protein